MATPLSPDIAALAAAIRKLGDNAEQQIHGFYKEVRRMVSSWDRRQGLGMRPSTITILKTIASGSGGGNTFMIPNDEDFVLYEVRGFLGFTDFANEVTLANHALSTDGAGNANFGDRFLIKANNCRVKITNNDTKVDITENNDIQLSSILAELGAPPLKYGGENRPAWVIPHGQTIKMTATLQSTIASIIGGSTDYGVELTGVYVTHQKAA